MKDEDPGVFILHLFRFGWFPTPVKEDDPVHRTLWKRHHAAALLAGVLVALTTLNPVWASEPALDPDLALVPPQPLLFVTVRAADLAEKLGVKDAPQKHPWSAAWEKMTGIPLHQVERCTFVAADDKSNCFIVRTKAPYKRDAVLNACVPDAKKEKYEGKVCHVSDKSDVAVHFASDRLVIVGDKDAVKQCLSAKGQRSPSFAGVLSRTGQHDLVCWMAVTQRVDQTRIFPIQPDALAELPPGIEKATIILDVGDKMNIEMRLDCDGEASTRKAEKLLHVSVAMAQFFLLQAICAQDLADVYPEMKEGAVAELRAIPIKLIRHAEKGLQDAKFRIDGKTAIASIVLPVDAKMVRSEMKELVKLSAACFGDPDCPLPFGNKDEPSTSITPYTPSEAAPPRNAIALPPIVADSPPAPGIVSQAPEAPRPPSATPPVVQPAPTIAAPVAQVKFTVANVRKETAVLFVMDDNGNMSFAAKVPAGEAVDLQSTSAQRWIAVFTDNPAAESFVVKEGNATWLLRPPPMRIPATPTQPACTSMY
jgi:hypothetical protein